MTAPDVWTILYSAPEESPKEQTGDIFPLSESYGRPLLKRSLVRARQLSASNHILAAVLEQEEPWWAAKTQDLPRENVVKQPFDRGSAAGILLSLARVYHRDPDARVVIFCSDHVDDDVLPAIHIGLERLLDETGRIHVLSRRPASSRSAANSVWMLPEVTGSQHSQVARMVFDPEPRMRDTLEAQQALLAAPVVLSSVRTALGLFERNHPDLAQQFRHRVLEGQGAFDPSVLEEIYPFLHVVDFFRGVLSKSPEQIWTIQVGAVDTARAVPQTTAQETTVSV